MSAHLASFAPPFQIYVACPSTEITGPFPFGGKGVLDGKRHDQLPAHAEAGDVYPIGLAYVDDGIVADCFINNKKDEAGRLQMTYVFTKGIYNGYIKINGEKKPKYSLGDVNNDGAINAVDASAVLTYYAMTSTNKKGDFDENQKLAADVDHNSSINAVDASCILSYYAYVSTTKDDPVSFEEYMKNT